MSKKLPYNQLLAHNLYAVASVNLKCLFEAIDAGRQSDGSYRLSPEKALTLCNYARMIEDEAKTIKRLSGAPD